MSKATTIENLAQAYSKQRRALTLRARTVYSDKYRWLEVVGAQHRRVSRKMRRSVGKSNKLGFRATASGRVAAMCEVDMWAQICRRNNLTRID
ncbi:hypothetical protein [Lelliottia wanjuensis]|uniref:hypothetical protein n=1 Tax=Lelliottia wanjuensis TaxID=3050585 RepID=UPI00254FA7B8|nr:hypothetical protein [Lelliottia sp. V104_15]MDK9607086.1 hypothetical protein [Lelliottia sp. V104_15]